MSEKNTESSTSSNEKSVFENLSFGLTVWKQNITRMFGDILHAFEVKQLEKRLEQEYAALGKATSRHIEPNDENPVAPNFEMVSALKQISFLKDEISRLKKEHTQDA